MPDSHYKLVKEWQLQQVSQNWWVFQLVVNSHSELVSIAIAYVWISFLVLPHWACLFSAVWGQLVQNYLSNSGSCFWCNTYFIRFAAICLDQLVSVLTKNTCAIKVNVFHLHTTSRQMNSHSNTDGTLKFFK